MKKRRVDERKKKNQAVDLIREKTCSAKWWFSYTAGGHRGERRGRFFIFLLFARTETAGLRVGGRRRDGGGQFKPLQLPAGYLSSHGREAV